MNKKYYWLKLKEDFFEEDTISWIEEQENGIYYINFYLKLCLKSLKSDGILIRNVGNMLVPYDAKQLSKITNTDVDTVRVAMELFKNIGLIEILESGEIYLNQLQSMVGSETNKAQLMRDKREKEKLFLLPKSEPKSNADRQRAHRAKKYCEERQHIPFIENYMNNKRYGGNYYIVFKRDEGKCRSCGSIENLCVHHIDGYDKYKPENNNVNKMITLCRSCHGDAHGKKGIDKKLLEAIGYYEESNESNVTCYQEIEKEIEIEIEREKDIYIEQPSPSASNSIKTTKEPKHKYGEFKHVLLTDK